MDGNMMTNMKLDRSINKARQHDKIRNKCHKRKPWVSNSGFTEPLSASLSHCCIFVCVIYITSNVLMIKKELRIQCYSWANHGISHFPLITNQLEISMGHSL